MNDQKYKYDVAFSFLKEDEKIAIELNDLIQDRYKTFLYSKNQEEVAGTDGELTFNNIFGIETRIVVVLYRKKWGTTPWTRIEQTAIRNRAFENGFEFAIFIPLDERVTLPNWVPKSEIYVGLRRWGHKGTASVIEAKIQKFGGEKRIENIHDKATRKKRELDFKEKRKNYLELESTVREANNEMSKCFKKLIELVADINMKNELSIITKQEGGSILDIFTKNYCVNLYWHQPYMNIIDDSKLIIKTFNGAPSSYSGSRFNQPQEQLKEELYFNIDYNFEPIWELIGRAIHFNTIELSEHCLNLLLDKIAEY